KEIPFGTFLTAPPGSPGDRGDEGKAATAPARPDIPCGGSSEKRRRREDPPGCTAPVRTWPGHGRAWRGRTTHRRSAAATYRPACAPRPHRHPHAAGPARSRRHARPPTHAAAPP